jgi:hypothetical protein
MVEGASSSTMIDERSSSRNGRPPTIAGLRVTVGWVADSLMHVLCVAAGASWDSPGAQHPTVCRRRRDQTDSRRIALGQHRPRRQNYTEIGIVSALESALETSDPNDIRVGPWSSFEPSGFRSIQP